MCVCVCVCMYGVKSEELTSYPTPPLQVRGDTAGKTGGRVYNPFQKQSSNFEMDPCRVGAPPSAPGVIDHKQAPAVIRLKASATVLPLHPPRGAV